MHVMHCWQCMMQVWTLGSVPALLRCGSHAFKCHAHCPEKLTRNLKPDRLIAATGMLPGATLCWPAEASWLPCCTGQLWAGLPRCKGSTPLSP